MSIFSILMFFIYTWGLGYSLTFFLKNSDNFLERNLMRVGIGLGVFSILLIILNFFHIPLDWRIILVLSLVLPLYNLAKSIKDKKLNFSPNFRIKKSDLMIFVVMLLFFLTLFMYAHGSFSYPYLEDADPWGHATGAKYISIEKTAYSPDVNPPVGRKFDVLSYVDPYPPAYDAIMGILHQTNSSINWTLKFFNSLIISLGVIFFYFFAKQFMGDMRKALFSTIIFALIPCYLSHFIWAHSLSVTLFFPLMYCFEMIRSDKRWAIPAAVIFAGVCVSQNLDEPMKIATLSIIYIIISSITNKRFQKEATFSLLAGGLLSLFWYGAMILKYKMSGFLSYYGVSAAGAAGAAASASSASSFNILAKLPTILSRIFDPGGTATRPYSLYEFFVAKPTNMINSPIGVGIFISIILLVSVVYLLYKHRSSIVKSENTWLMIALFWLLYTFLGVNQATFNITISRAAFRVWMLMAIPISLLCSEGISFMLSKKNNIYLWAAVFLTTLFSMKVHGSQEILFPNQNIWFILLLLVSFFNLVVITLGLVAANKKTDLGVIGIYSLIFILFFGAFLTSGFQKYTVNNAIWPTGSGFIAGPSEAIEYAKWFKTIQPNTKVFFYSRLDQYAIGLDAFSCHWCQNIMDFRYNITQYNVSELYSFLKNNKYKYLIFGRADFKFTAKDEESQKKLSAFIGETISSGKFTVDYEVKDMMVVLKVI